MAWSLAVRAYASLFPKPPSLSDHSSTYAVRRQYGQHGYANVGCFALADFPLQRHERPACVSSLLVYRERHDATMHRYQTSAGNGKGRVEKEQKTYRL